MSGGVLHERAVSRSHSIILCLNGWLPVSS